MTTGRSVAGGDIGHPGGEVGAPNAVGTVAPLRVIRASITLAHAFPSGPRIARELGRQIVDQFDRLPLWAPVAFGLGAALYLGLKTEPSVWVAGSVAALACLVAAGARLHARHRASFVISWLAALLACGFLCAKVHSDRVAAPIAPNGLGVVSVRGWVVDIETPGEHGERLLIAPTRISGLAPDRTPTRIRLVVASPGGPESLPPPGSAISVATLLDPPPGPASPGAYDFARDAWFEGIGGVGLAMRPPAPTFLDDPPWPLRLDMAVNALRWSVAERLADGISRVMGPNDQGASGLAVAVTTSHQDWLASDHRDDLRASGLAHMLAIAGLHTAAISGFAFFAFRLAIAAWPWLALRIPGKKVAAVGALVVVACYLVLSGAHPPARRAAITASVAFFAILVDRRAVSLHSLAMAALLILIVEPDVVLAPGFEMSFCATASLVALAEIWRRPVAAVGLAWPLAVLQKARDGLVALAMVSFVAGMATGPFAIQHFNRVANYGVFANLTADFLASALLMPALGLSLLAQALGLDSSLAAPVYWLAGWAARGVLLLGHVFAAAPGASVSLSSAPQVALAVSYVGIVFACLWRGSLRWIGVPMAAAVALWPRPAAPVAWIASDGDDAAIVAAGQEVPLKPGVRAYATQLWAQRRGLTMARTPGEAVARQKAAFDCNRIACAPLGAGRPAIAAWWTRRKPPAGRLDALCAHADILILRADVATPPGCATAIVLRRAAFAGGGSAEVFATPGGWRIAWSQAERGRRPWTLNDSGG